MPTTLHEFFNNGGMAAVERAAACRAIADERASWLPILEAWAAALGDDDDVLMVIWLDGEIRRARRLLHLPPVPSPQAVEQRREKTRERVRRYRQRLKAEAS
jgi:hypothetical protein